MMDNTYKMFVVDLPDYVAWIFLIVVILLFVIPPLVHYFYKGVVREIEVVKCRKTFHEIYDINIMSRWRYNNTTQITHLTVDFRYKGRRFVHTANCFNEKLFNSLKQGKKYKVRIRLNTIVSIEK